MRCCGWCASYVRLTDHGLIDGSIAASSSEAATGPTTYKLIIWGSGQEVPSLLFDLVKDPMVRQPRHHTTPTRNHKHAPLFEYSYAIQVRAV